MPKHRASRPDIAFSMVDNDGLLEHTKGLQPQAFRYPTPPEEVVDGTYAKRGAATAAAAATSQHSVHTEVNAGFDSHAPKQQLRRSSRKNADRGSLPGSKPNTSNRAVTRKATISHRTSLSLSATHPTMYNGAAKPTRAAEQPSVIPPSSRHANAASHAHLTLATEVAASYTSLSRIIDPTAQTHAVNGLPPLWTASAMMGSRDYQTTFGIVLSPTFMIGLPCGSMIELAHPYQVV